MGHSSSTVSFGPHRFSKPHSLSRIQILPPLRLTHTLNRLPAYEGPVPGPVFSDVSAASDFAIHKLAGYKSTHLLYNLTKQSRGGCRGRVKSQLGHCVIWGGQVIPQLVIGLSRRVVTDTGRVGIIWEEMVMLLPNLVVKHRSTAVNKPNDPAANQNTLSRADWRYANFLVPLLLPYAVTAVGPC